MKNWNERRTTAYKYKFEIGDWVHILLWIRYVAQKVEKQQQQQQERQSNIGTIGNSGEEKSNG